MYVRVVFELPVKLSFLFPQTSQLPSLPWPYLQQLFRQKQTIVHKQKSQDTRGEP